MYYQNKKKILEDIFGTQKIDLKSETISINNQTYPIVNDVIVLTDKENESVDFVSDIQFTFGEEWEKYPAISQEHCQEFYQYFDLVDFASLKNLRICDLGCGNGRWSYFLKNYCKEMILVDFSDAIFVARKNLANADNCIFIKCNLKKLPLKEDFADLILCLGVLHHMPTDCINEVRNLKRFSSQLLIYLYYNLDNRSIHYRYLLQLVTKLRLKTSQIHHAFLRKFFVKIGVFFIYLPLITLGRLLKLFRLENQIPLYEAYHNKSIKRIEQDVYDRFFTRIEQRVGKNDILKLKNDFTSVIVSENPPYYHFLCRK